MTTIEKAAIDYSNDSIDHSKMLRIAFTKGATWALEEVVKQFKESHDFNGTDNPISEASLLLEQIIEKLKEK